MDPDKMNDITDLEKSMEKDKTDQGTSLSEMKGITTAISLIKLLAG